MLKNSLFTLCLLVVAQIVSAQKYKYAETRVLESFNKLSVSAGFEKIILKPGDKESIFLSSNGTSLDKIKTFVKNNSLVIEPEKNNYKGCKDVTVIITYKELNTINTSGTTDIYTEGTLKTGKFTFNASGSGDLHADLNVTEIHANISGSSDLHLSGEASDQYYAISGSGDVHAERLHGKTAKVAVSGSGDVALNVEGDVKSSVSGSGDVTNSKTRRVRSN